MSLVMLPDDLCLSYTHEMNCAIWSTGPIHAEPAEQSVHVAMMCCLCGQKRESLRQLCAKSLLSESSSFKVERAF